jgi:hypothetical protein
MRDCFLRCSLPDGSFIVQAWVVLHFMHDMHQQTASKPACCRLQQMGAAAKGLDSGTRQWSAATAQTHSDQVSSSCA